MRFVIRRRVLHQIEQNLACSDPDLSKLFFDFSWRTGGLPMPRVERIRAAPLRVILRLRRRKAYHQHVRTRAS